jgi:hypothetical protein
MSSSQVAPRTFAIPMHLLPILRYSLHDIPGEKKRLVGLIVSSGLGALLSTTFALHGCNIAINYFNRDGPAKDIASACEKHGVKSMIVKADMTVTADARRAVRETVEGLGGLDIIISNAVSFEYDLGRGRLRGLNGRCVCVC